MFAIRRLAVFLILTAAGFLMAACQGGGGSDSAGEAIFGDGGADTSPVIARVAGFEITQQDLDLRFDELPQQRKSRYKGPDGQRLLLKNMIKDAILVRGALDEGLLNDQSVRRQVISLRRSTLRSAMRSYGILADKQPTEEELMKYFRDNQDSYKIMGMVQARHVTCLKKEEADEAYARLTAGGLGNEFATVAKEVSVNRRTAREEGNIGWYNDGGFIPDVANSKEFTKATFDLSIGINEPVFVKDRWHVVEILRREYDRPKTFGEARPEILEAMLPMWQEMLVDDYVADAKRRMSIELFDEYAPGKGLSDEELFARGRAIKDPAQQIEIFDMLVEDYPQSDRADDALFLAANTANDVWSDRRMMERYLKRLLEGYPDSELREDAQFLLDNLYNKKSNPSSIEDLRN